MNLDGGIANEIFFDLENGRPEYGTRTIWFRRPEGRAVKILGFEDAGEERIFVSG